MMLFMIIFHQLSHIMFNIILCRSLDFAKIINSFSVQLCCQPSHLLLDESKVFFFHCNSCNCSMIEIDIVKRETKKRKPITAGFRNTSTSFWYTCSSVFFRVGHKSRSGQRIKRRIIFSYPCFIS